MTEDFQVLDLAVNKWVKGIMWISSVSGLQKPWKKS